jgi:hypothetical protein
MHAQTTDFIPGHHEPHCGARLGSVKSLRFAPTLLRKARVLDGVLGRALKTAFT